MTENKRFTLCEGTITGLKSYYEYDGMPLTHLQVLDLFNKLCDKNKELSEEIEQLKFQNSNLMKEVAEYSRKAKDKEMECNND